METIDNILFDAAKKGLCSVDIITQVLPVLEPYFENKDMLGKYILTSELLSVYEHLSEYRRINDPIFISGLQETLSIYRNAYLSNPEKVKEMFWEAHDEFSQKESFMCAVKETIPNNLFGELYDAVLSYMRYIEASLETGTKHILIEVLALQKIIIGAKFDYDTIRKKKFGTVISEMLAHHKLEKVLYTDPIKISISDWRNIASHNTYTIEQKTIKCSCKDGRMQFEILYDDLLLYVHQIIRASNILHIARCIFGFDHLDEYNLSKPPDIKPAEFSQTLLVKNLKIRSYARQLLLEYIDDTDQAIVLKMNDLANDGTLSKTELDERTKISADFMFQSWHIYRKTIIMIYSNKAGEEQQLLQVENVECERYDKSDKSFPLRVNKKGIQIV